LARKKAEPKPIEEPELTEQAEIAEQMEQPAADEAAEQMAQELAPDNENVEDVSPGEAAEEETPDTEMFMEADPALGSCTPIPEDTDADAAELAPPDAELPPDAPLEGGEMEASGLDTEEDYGALLDETSNLGLNSHANAEEPLTLPECGEEPDAFAPADTDNAEPSEHERRTLDEYVKNSASAAPMRERIGRSAAAAPIPRDERILTIDAHDDVLTEAEREEIVWHEIRNSHISQQILTGSLDSMERTPSGITVAVATYKGFRIAIPLKEMLVLPSRWPSREARMEAMEQLPRQINMRMGSEIDFIVKGIDSENRSVVASRRSAMLHKRQTFYMDRAATGLPMIYPGRVVQARVVAVADKVIRVEVFGVECAIRASGIAWEWIGNAREFYSVGERVLVRVLSIDRPNVENISIKADIRSISKNTNHDNLHKCKPQDKYVGRVTDNLGGVVFIRLNNGVNAIAHTCKDPRRPGRKDDVSFVVTKLDEEQGVAIGIITKIIRQNL